MTARLRWDLFCRVVDNFGDVGFAWRLATDLASRGHAVRLWLDDAAALRWMAPTGAPRVDVHPWTAAAAAESVGDVVVETFGCGVPDGFASRMGHRTPAPVWINLQYLSAETVVERNHALPSPRHTGPAAGLVQWFFYPGFSARTGGLIHEAGLAAAQGNFSKAPWLESLAAERGFALQGQRIVSLFCYENAALPPLLDTLSAQPTLLLVAAGKPADQVRDQLGPSFTRGLLQALPLPWLSQIEYDHLLWSCDLNFVRGEDSFVRAQWAGVPFVWQVYPQADGVHATKLDAFLEVFLRESEAGPALDTPLRQTFRAWNQLEPWPGLPKLRAWSGLAHAWRGRLLAQPSLTDRLIAFTKSKC